MTQLTAREVEGFYLAEGGPKNRAVAWVSVAFGESGYNTRAESPVGARGLYQFMSGSWPGGLGSYDNAWDPWSNTRAMLILSGGGMNFAPWDSCYANINRSGRYAYLSWPERGSAVSNDMFGVAIALAAGAVPILGRPPEPGIAGQLPSALSWYGQTTSTVVPQMVARTKRLYTAAARSYRR